MATKARHKKTAMQLWVVDNRKRLGLDPADLALLTGVSEDTARGWESRGRPSDEAIVRLEQRFGVPAPRQDEAGAGDSVAIAAAIDRLGERMERAIAARDEVIGALLEELATYRRQTLDRQQVEQTLLQALPGALADALAATRGTGPSSGSGAADPRRTAAGR